MTRFLKLSILSVLSKVWCGALRIRGVEIKSNAWILGRPRIKRAKGSRIRLGSHVSLFSSAFANPLGPQAPTFLHTTSQQALIDIFDFAGISSSTIVAREKIIIGERTLIGADCLIIDNDFHSLDPLVRGQADVDIPKSAPVHIGNNVFIGTRCIILKGTHIGDGAVIGAGSVVQGKVPPGTVYAGNPAKPLIRNSESK